MNLNDIAHVHDILGALGRGEAPQVILMA